VALVLGCVAAGTGRAQPDPAAILAAARAALGGDQALSAVKTFTVSGEHMRDLGGHRLTTMVDVACELPDKFVQEDNTVGPFESTRRAGFNGDDLISQTIAPDAPGPVTINAAPGNETPEQIAARRKSAVLMRKQEFARFTLALFARDFSSYPLQSTYLSQVPLHEGPADVIEVRGEGKFVVHLFIDATTHRPVLISWLTRAALDFASRAPLAPMSSQPGPVPAPSLPGVVPSQPAATQPPPGTVAVSGLPPLINPTPAELERRAKLVKEQADAIGASLPLVEHQLVLSDVREADGLRWPHKFTEYIESTVVEETKLGKFKINARIGPGKFKVSK
jgi:hypothetical protein